MLYSPIRLADKDHEVINPSFLNDSSTSATHNVALDAVAVTLSL